MQAQGHASDLRQQSGSKPLVIVAFWGEYRSKWGGQLDMFENAPEQALAWHRAGKGAALATVIQTWGSAPRRIGAQLAIAGDWRNAGLGFGRLR